MQKIVEPQTYKVLIIARSGYGKTVISIEFFKQLIKTKDLDPKRLVIFSQTVRSDPKQLAFIKWIQKKCGRDYDFKHNNTAKEIKFKFLEDLYNHQVKIKEEGKQYHHWFIWFDDQIIDNDIRFGAHPVLRKIAFIGRHFGISQLWNMQSYRSSIEPSIREQITNIFLGDLQSDEKKLDVVRQFSSGFDPDPRKSTQRLYEEYNEVLKTNDRHGFLNIHTEKTLGNGRFQINLSDKFLDPDFVPSKKMNGIIGQRNKTNQKQDLRPEFFKDRSTEPNEVKATGYRGDVITSQTSHFQPEIYEVSIKTKRHKQTRQRLARRQDKSRPSNEIVQFPVIDIVKG